METERLQTPELRKLWLAGLVEQGELTAEQAALIGVHDPSEEALAYGSALAEKLAGRRAELQRGLAPHASNASSAAVAAR